MEETFTSTAVKTDRIFGDNEQVKKQSAVPTPSFDEPPDKQARRNSAALKYNLLWNNSKINEVRIRLIKQKYKDIQTCISWISPELCKFLR